VSIATISVAGTAVELATIGADVLVRVGRQDIYSKASTSTASIVFYGVETDVTRPYVGAEVIITATGSYAVFRGIISDATLSVDSPTSGARLTVTAIGNSSRLAYVKVGGSGYPAQTVGNRLDAIMSEAGFSTSTFPKYAIDAPASVTSRTVAAYTGGEATAQTLIDQVSESTRGFLYDSRDGRVVWQAIEQRNTLAFDSVSSSATIFAPEWRQDTQVINDVTVVWSSGNVYGTDARSISAYGTRELSVTTILDVQADATTLASSLLARSKRPRWQLVNVGTITTSDSTIEPGQPVTISNLPAGSPAAKAYGVVEGYENRYYRGDHTVSYFISDPVQSGIALAWEDIPASTAYQWQDALAGVVWDDAITLSDLFTVA
jgi:hypothetical protein